MDLNSIFLKEQQQKAYRYKIHDRIIMNEVTKFLQDEVDEWEKVIGSSKSDFCFAITVPENWNYEIRERMLRPLLAQSGLINKNDHPDRIIFFTGLESVFQYLQNTNFSHKIKNGKQYAICSLELNDDDMCVDINLALAHDPSLTTIDNDYVPHSLSSVSFRFPFKLKKKSEWIKASLRKRCTTVLPPELIDMLTTNSQLTRV